MSLINAIHLSVNDHGLVGSFTDPQGNKTSTIPFQLDFKKHNTINIENEV